MKLTIDIDEKEITEIVSQKLVDEIMDDVKDWRLNRAKGFGIRDGIDKGIKNYIYKNKDYVIERIIDRCSKYFIRKAEKKCN